MAVVDGRYDIQVASLLDLLGPACSGNAWAVSVERVARAYAMQKRWYNLYTRIYAVRTHSWGTPCLRNDRLLNLGSRNGDGSGW